MKTLGRILLFLLSTVLRTLPLLIFVMTHIAWGIYTYTIDPIRLLRVGQVITVLEDFKWLYLGLGIAILVFLTLRFKILAYCTFFGAWIGQNLHFLRQWDNRIYDMNQPSLLNTWYALMFSGLLAGFVLQVLYTGGRKYYKIRKYNRLRRQSQPLKSA